MKLKYLFLVATVLVCATGCSQYKNITLDNLTVKQVNMSGISSAKIKVAATVNNPSRSKVTLKDAMGSIRLDGKQVAVYTLEEPMLFAARDTSSADGLLLVDVTNLFALFGTGLDIDSSLLDRVTFDIDANFKCGSMKMHKKFSDIAAKDMIEFKTGK